MSWTVLIALAAALIIGGAIGVSLGMVSQSESDAEVIRLRRLLEENGIRVPWEYPG